MTVRRHAEVGDKLRHEDYGEGLVVEVRARPFFDILEVAFADGVRRLNSNHPKILEVVEASSLPAGQPVVKRRRKAPAGRPAGAAAAKPARAARGARAAGPAPQAASEPASEAAPEPAAEEMPAAAEEPAAVSAAAEEVEAAPRFAFTDRESLFLDSASVEEYIEARPREGDLGRGFLVGLRAERMSLTRGFENLLCLSAVRDLERYDFQIQACFACCGRCAGARSWPTRSGSARRSRRGSS